MTRVGFLLFVSLVFSSWGNAQDNCPEGFRNAGTLSGTGSAWQPLDERKTIRFRENVMLDESFQQRNVRATNGKSGVQSALRGQDIPKGVLIIPHGKSDDIYHQGWAVSDPELKGIERDANGRITQYEFGMKLFCRVGSTGANPHFGECSVDVDVCYKPQLSN
jgi:hypothetical protein